MAIVKGEGLINTDEMMMDRPQGQLLDETEYKNRKENDFFPPVI
jgi:hypothetical protein